MTEGFWASTAYLRTQLRQIGLFLALILIIIFFQVATDGTTLRPINVSNLVVQNGYVLILAIGMLMVIIGGHIDLSVGSVAGLSGAVAGVAITRWGLPIELTFVLCLGVGALVGIWQGYWVAYFHIPAFIVTLAGMLTFRGLTQIVLDNASISPFPRQFRTLGSGFLPRLGDSALDPLTLALAVLAVVGLILFSVRGRILRRRYGVSDHPMAWFVTRIVCSSALILMVGVLLAAYRGTPVVLVFLGLLTVAYSAVMQNTVFGRQVYAMGGNLAAANLSGVNTARVTFLLMVNMSVLAALAGLLFAAQLNLANPTNGVGFELDAIAAVFIGGAAVTGGIGTVGGAIIGGLIIGILNNGMSILGIGQQYQALIKGLVLMAAVTFDVYNKRRTGR